MVPLTCNRMLHETPLWFMLASLEGKEEELCPSGKPAVCLWCFVSLSFISMAFCPVCFLCVCLYVRLSSLHVPIWSYSLLHSPAPYLPSPPTTVIGPCLSCDLLPSFLSFSVWLGWLRSHKGRSSPLTKRFLSLFYVEFAMLLHGYISGTWRICLSFCLYVFFNIRFLNFSISSGMFKRNSFQMLSFPSVAISQRS